MSDIAQSQHCNRNNLLCYEKKWPLKKDAPQICLTKVAIVHLDLWAKCSFKTLTKLTTINFQKIEVAKLTIWPFSLNGTGFNYMYYREGNIGQNLSKCTCLDCVSFFLLSPSQDTRRTHNSKLNFKNFNLRLILYNKIFILQK